MFTYFNANDQDMFFKPQVQAITAFKHLPRKPKTPKNTQNNQLSVDKAEINANRSSMEYSDVINETTLMTNSTINIPLSTVITTTSTTKHNLSYNGASNNSSSAIKDEKHSQNKVNCLAANTVSSNKIDHNSGCDHIQYKHPKHSVTSNIDLSSSPQSSVSR